jgi:hypothetical protein
LPTDLAAIEQTVDPARQIIGGNLVLEAVSNYR